MCGCSQSGPTRSGRRSQSSRCCGCILCVCTGSEPAAASPLHHVLCCGQGPLDKQERNEQTVGMLNYIISLKYWSNTTYSCNAIRIPKGYYQDTVRIFLTYFQDTIRILGKCNYSLQENRCNFNRNYSIKNEDENVQHIFFGTKCLHYFHGYS